MATFDHLGLQIEVVPTSKWTWPEAAVAKEVSGGMGVAEIERRAAEGDPDALVAVLTVSIQRTRPHAEPRHIRHEIMASGRTLLEVVEEIVSEVGDVEEAIDPPGEAAHEGGTTPSPTTTDHATSGTPPSSSSG